MKKSRNDPEVWSQFFSEHSKGDEIDGKVTNVVQFGAFVELADGIDGLVHISESNGPLTLGDEVRVRVLDMDATTRRISLTPASS